MVDVTRVTHVNRNSNVRHHANMYVYSDGAAPKGDKIQINCKDEKTIKIQKRKNYHLHWTLFPHSSVLYSTTKTFRLEICAKDLYNANQIIAVANKCFKNELKIV